MTVWIKSGTVAVTNGSATVQGTGTGLYGKVAPGYAFVGPDGRIYEVVAVNLAEQITLASPYLGATASGAAYAIYPTLGLAAQLVAAVQALITAQQAIEASQVVAANGDREFYSAEGAVIAMLKNSGRLGIGAGNIDPKSLLSLRSINPSIDLVETDSPVAGEISRILRNGGYVDFQTVDGDTLISNDYRMQLGALGALRHEWRINNSQVMNLNSSGLLGIGTANPIRLVHISQASSSSSTRMRLENGDGWVDLLADDGRFRVTCAATGGADQEFLDFYGDGRMDIKGDTTNNNARLSVRSANLAFSNDALRIAMDRAAATNFDFLTCRSSYQSGQDMKMRFRGDGSILIDGFVSTTGADVGEFFEHLDGNPNAEDRVGLSVVLENGKIRPTTAQDPASAIIGVISATASSIGNSDNDQWWGKYLRDALGRVLTEEAELLRWTEVLTETRTEMRQATRTVQLEVQVIEVIEGQAVLRRETRSEEEPLFDDFPIVDESGAAVLVNGAQAIHRVPRMVETEVQIEKPEVRVFYADQVPEGVSVPEGAERIAEMRQVLNPEFDPELEYVSRADRAEWDVVGLLGQIRLRKGQPVGSRWIKMRDITEDVEEWLVW